MLRASAMLVGLASIAVARTAFAEDGDAGARNPIQYTTEPLRLLLTRDQFPFMARMPGCESAGAPEDKWLTRALSPHLHFLAIMRSGCGLETGGGGGLAYSTEIRPDVFFVASLGMWLTPPIHDTRDMRMDALGRLDLVFRLKEGRSLNVGLFATRSMFGFGFGGVF